VVERLTEALSSIPSSTKKKEKEEEEEEKLLSYCKGKKKHCFLLKVFWSLLFGL
jgi:hypothetical protein